ncbi:hypothetical protein BKA69DRAFT_1072497 [Paraphysoderma sedebokerense]|nr:hypothetical protein BKA69DRAFT_1072497 [Paraphysoderma sedebokerense]
MDNLQKVRSQLLGQGILKGYQSIKTSISWIDLYPFFHIPPPSPHSPTNVTSVSITSIIAALLHALGGHLIPSNTLLSLTARFSFAKVFQRYKTRFMNASLAGTIMTTDIQDFQNIISKCEFDVHTCHHGVIEAELISQDGYRDGILGIMSTDNLYTQQNLAEVKVNTVAGKNVKRMDELELFCFGEDQNRQSRKSNNRFRIRSCKFQFIIQSCNISPDLFAAEAATTTSSSSDHLPIPLHTLDLAKSSSYVIHPSESFHVNPTIYQKFESWAEMNSVAVVNVTLASVKQAEEAENGESSNVEELMPTGADSDSSGEVERIGLVFPIDQNIGILRFLREGVDITTLKKLESSPSIATAVPPLTSTDLEKFVPTLILPSPSHSKMYDLQFGSLPETDNPACLAIPTEHVHAESEFQESLPDPIDPNSTVQDENKPTEQPSESILEELKSMEEKLNDCETVEEVLEWFDLAVAEMLVVRQTNLLKFAETHLYAIKNKLKYLSPTLDDSNLQFFLDHIKHKYILKLNELEAKYKTVLPQFLRNVLNNELTDDMANEATLEGIRPREIELIKRLEKEDLLKITSDDEFQEWINIGKSRESQLQMVLLFEAMMLHDMLGTSLPHTILSPPSAVARKTSLPINVFPKRLKSFSKPSKNENQSAAGKPKPERKSSINSDTSVSTSNSADNGVEKPKTVFAPPPPTQASKSKEDDYTKLLNQYTSRLSLWCSFGNLKIDLTGIADVLPGPTGNQEKVSDDVKLRKWIERVIIRVYYQSCDALQDIITRVYSMCGGEISKYLDSAVNPFSPAQFKFGLPRITKRRTKRATADEESQFMDKKSKRKSVNQKKSSIAGNLKRMVDVPKVNKSKTKSNAQSKSQGKAQEKSKGLNDAGIDTKNIIDFESRLTRSAKRSKINKIDSKLLNPGDMPSTAKGRKLFPSHIPDISPGMVSPIYMVAKNTRSAKKKYGSTSVIDFSSTESQASPNRGPRSKKTTVKDIKRSNSFTAMMMEKINEQDSDSDNSSSLSDPPTSADSGESDLEEESQETVQVPEGESIQEEEDIEEHDLHDTFMSPSTQRVIRTGSRSTKKRLTSLMTLSSGHKRPNNDTADTPIADTPVKRLKADPTVELVDNSANEVVKSGVHTRRGVLPFASANLTTESPSPIVKKRSFSFGKSSLLENNNSNDPPVVSNDHNNPFHDTVLTRPSQIRRPPTRSNSFTASQTSRVCSPEPTNSSLQSIPKIKITRTKSFHASTAATTQHVPSFWNSEQQSESTSSSQYIPSSWCLQSTQQESETISFKIRIPAQKENPAAERKSRASSNIRRIEKSLKTRIAGEQMRSKSTGGIPNDSGDISPARDIENSDGAIPSSDIQEDSQPVLVKRREFNVSSILASYFPQE